VFRNANAESAVKTVDRGTQYLAVEKHRARTGRIRTSTGAGARQAIGTNLSPTATRQPDS